MLVEFGGFALRDLLRLVRHFNAAKLHDWAQRVHPVTVRAYMWRGMEAESQGSYDRLIATLTEGACTYEIDKLTSFPTGVV